ncbi:MAG: hypothetical protein JWM16_5328 [Verrucomicrobiales bacterium]|nr:hypothetical protein [Verrucomicrobiales bacterium]
MLKRKITVCEWNQATLSTAFDGDRRLATGSLAEVVAKAKTVLDRQGSRATLLILDSITAHQIEVDFRGSLRAVLARLPKPDTSLLRKEGAEAIDEAARGPGRPRLGVVSREVTLLPRHWEWLGEQPGGASVALRKLVEAARRTGADASRKRRAQEAAYRFITTMAGNRPGYEEATRALFAGDFEAFRLQMAGWPIDIRNFALDLGRVAMQGTTLPADLAN